MTIETLEETFLAARDAANAATTEISPAAWNAVKSSAARLEYGPVSTTAYDAEGQPIGMAFRSAKYGLCCYRYAAAYPALLAAQLDAAAALMAAKKAAGHFRPVGDELKRQRRRSELGQTRPAGMPRAHHYAQAAAA